MSQMSSDTYDYLKKCVEVFERTGNDDVRREIKAILDNHSDDSNAKTLTRNLRL